MMSLGSRAEQGYFLAGPEPALQGGSGLLVSPWRRGTNGVAAPEFCPPPTLTQVCGSPQLHICVAPEL